MTIHSALILTAGLGTRLRPLTNVRAKAAIPVAGEPIIRRIITWLAAQDVTNLVLNLHHLPETICGIVGEGRDLGTRVRYSWEQPRVLGSGGGPRKALPIVGADPCIIVNGDTLTDLAVRRLADAHAHSGALVTLALVPNTAFHRYGGVLLDTAGAVTGFVSRGPAAEGSYHYIGVQVANRAAFDAVAEGSFAASMGGVYDDLITSRAGSVRGYVCDVAFADIGTVGDYWRTSFAFDSDRGDAAVFAGRNVRIAPSAHVTQSILWDDVEIGADAVVEECIVTDGATVPPSAVHRRSVIVRRNDGDAVAVSPLII